MARPTPAEIPIAGDWNGDGKDTIGLYNPATSTFSLKNTNDSANANVTFAFGAANSGSAPIVGNWDGSPSKAGKSGMDANSAAALPDGAVLSLAMRGTVLEQLGANRFDLGHNAAASDWLVASTPAPHEDVFSRLASSDPLTALGNQFEYRLAARLADAGLPHLETASWSDVRSGTDDALPTTGDQTSAEDLLASCSVERHATDEVFDLLGDLD